MVYSPRHGDHLDNHNVFFAPFKNFMADAHHIYDFKPPKCISFISFELAMPEDGDGQCILYGMMHSLSHTTLFCEK